VQALRGNDITVYGDGSQTRSFCYVDDLVEGLIRMMNQSGFIGPVNLGNPMETSIRQFAEIIVELTGSHSRIVNKPLPADDPRQRQPSIALAKEKLGWTPGTALRDGLGKTADYFRAKIQPAPKPAC